ncbi:MAG: xanthine/uracil/vitamin C permease [Gammaproteobacteria bacterium]|nr:xanthine/uracil/vitamin C permease [Gammaproteobacteria bacterium]
MATGNDLPTSVRYEADERPPFPLSVGLGVQLMVLIVAGIVLTPAIVIRAAGGSEAYLAWAVFAAVAISGTTTVMQAVRFGRIGAGYVLAMGTSGAFIAICVTALVEGGPALLATLVVISALFQFTFSARLSLFRRVLTPTVAGTVIMLIAVTVMPIIFGMLTEVPEDAPPLGAPICAVATLITVCAIALKASGALRLWAPVIGVAVGSMVAAYFGLYDTNRVAEASWIGFPTVGWPGFDLEFGAAFWSLLPAFIFVTLVGAIETIGDSVAIQRVSWKTRKAVDFRAVQGAVAADGMGNLLSGLAGTVPNTTYSTSVSVTELTGVGARVVGLVLGIVMVAFAFFPKALAVVLAIPGPVAAAYVTVLLAMLFVVGMKIIVQDGVDYRKGLIVGVSFWLGVGFQNGVIFPEFVADFAGGLLQNGMTAGGLAAILLTLFVELTAPRRHRIELAFELSALPSIRQFLAECASRYRWDEAMTQRLDAASEETLLTLLPDDEAQEEPADCN